jgi:hypothetical protein
MQLNEYSPMITQPRGLNIELMQHQKTSVYAMKQMETQRYVDIKFRYFDNEEKDIRLETSLGILGDKVGAGKTLMILTLIMESEKPINRPRYYASDKYVTIREIEDPVETMNLNVIMVPSEQIQNQWIDAMTKFVEQGEIKIINHVNATTRPKGIFDRPELDGIKNDQNITILCNDRSIDDLIELSRGRRWNRFVIDEADTIQFTKIDKINASFIWLVTGTNQGICHSKKKYIKEIFGKNIGWQPEYLTIKNEDKFVELSLNLPKPNRIKINCLTPIEIRLLAGHIPRHVMNMINAGNTDDAIRELNCHVDTSDNIYKVIDRNYRRAIKNKEIELEAERKKEYNVKKNQHEEQEHEHEKRIRRLETVIERLRSKLKSMKNALYEINDSMCPICMGDFKKTTLVDCCAHKYCFDCLVLVLDSTGNKCPVCQTRVTRKMMHIIEDDEEEEDQRDEDKRKEVKVREKIIELMEIVKRDGKYLVFADYDETFVKIKREMEKHNILYEILKGNGKKIQQILTDFEKGVIRVIMLNAKNFGAGINLQCATDIVMYHRFTKGMEEQIIGRGQRMGRQSVLNVHYLIHENEKDSFDDEYFQMNDMSHQDYLNYLEGIDATD